MGSYFKAASWDPFIIIITALIYTVAAAFIFSNPGLTTILVFGTLIVVPPFFMIRGYSIDGQKLVIHRLGWTKKVDIHGLKDVSYQADAFKRSWRLLGNGGLFGWIGTFSNKKLGTFRAYATNRYKCVALKLDNRTLVLTPASPTDFIQRIRKLFHK